MKKFEELKAELLEKAKEKDACSNEYKRAYKSETEEELLNVIYDNLGWCVGVKIVSHEYFAKFNKTKLIESGIGNIGEDNTGYQNSGNWNSGYRNSGYWNSGDRNSGYRNSGDCNSGDRNSGNSNSGNWNSGYRNSGDSNSGYRNSGAFCTDENPKAIIFNKESSLSVKEWEQSKAYDLMYRLNFTFWVGESEMTETEKKDNPHYKTTGGYLKTISHKEGWANFWGNLSDEDKQVFKDIENFDVNIFEQITGIKI